MESKGPKGQFLRSQNPGRWKKLANGKFGGFAKGVINGPPPRRPARARKG